MDPGRIADDRVRQRLMLLRRAQVIGAAAACRECGKHLSYYYYWRRRYQASGGAGRSLQTQPSRPRRMPRLSRPAVVQRVLALRAQTHWGKARLANQLRLPASTVGHILRRARVTRPPRRWSTQKKQRKMYNLLIPGQRVQMDVKYVPFRIGGRRYFQYTVIDECTRLRYLVIRDALWTRDSVEALAAAQRYFGFPIQCVQTDNGTEFTFRFTAELRAKHNRPKVHPLDAHCDAHGIQHRCIPGSSDPAGRRA